MDDEKTKALKTYILKEFSTAYALNGWLVEHIWSAYRGAKVSGAQMEISKGAVDLDGSPLRESEVSRRAAHGDPVRLIRTGLVCTWNSKKKCWTPTVDQT